MSNANFEYFKGLRAPDFTTDIGVHAPSLQSVSMSVDVEQERFVSEVPPTVRDGKYVGVLSGGRTITLTLDPDFQHSAERVVQAVKKKGLAEDFGVVVARPNGEILAWAERSETANFCGLNFPGASLAKLVTTAALIDSGVSRSELTPYPVIDYKRDWEPVLDSDAMKSAKTALAQLDEALARSMTAAFPHIAMAHLPGKPHEQARILADAFKAFGFSGQITPENYARAAAGLEDTRLSAFFAARMAASIANGGQLPKLSMVERIENQAGETEWKFQPSRLGRTMRESTSKTILEMLRMASTPYGFDEKDGGAAESGTARGAFFDGFTPKLRGISVSSKGGTINDIPVEVGERTFQGFKWFSAIPQVWSRQDLEPPFPTRAESKPPFVVVVLAHKPHSKYKYVCNNAGKALIEKGLRGEGTFDIPGVFSLSI